jgi:2-deoxy-D-gluconate 3-dehydrogenase
MIGLNLLIPIIMKNLNELLDLSGQTAVVTGGSRGIGLGIAYRLAEAGANVLIASVHQGEVDEAVAQLKEKGWKAAGVVADVSREEDVQKMVVAAKENFGSLDVMVNNAGIFPNQPLLDMSAENFQKVIDVNLKGVYLCTRHAAKQMIEQGHGGKIINITSIDALHPSMVGLAHYDASKHGVWGFTKNTALELSRHNIWVNAVAPGGVATPGVVEMNKPAEGAAPQDEAAKAAAAKSLDAFMAKIPMHRMGEPDDIGKVVLFLASDMSSYITGSQIVVDGGALLG